MENAGEHLGGLAGQEWIVDAFGCLPERLRDEGQIRKIFEDAVRELSLHPVGEAHFHQFPGAGGITGFVMLSESHLSCHTFPETGYAAFNLYSCRPRETWPWAERLQEALLATDVRVRRVSRPEMAVDGEP